MYYLKRYHIIFTSLEVIFMIKSNAPTMKDVAKEAGVAVGRLDDLAVEPAHPAGRGERLSKGLLRGAAGGLRLD